MIGCDVSGYFSFRVTDWRYREVSEDESAESESGVLLSFTLAAQAVGLHSWRHLYCCAHEYCLDLCDLRATVLALLHGKVPISVAKCLIVEQRS